MSTPSDPPSSDPEVTLDKGRHIRYWLRCLRTLLPPPYLSNDSFRSTLGYFIVAALDLLQTPECATADLLPQELVAVRRWVFNLMLPGGGFVGNDNLVLCLQLDDYPKNEWPGMMEGNLSGTFFALLLLILTWKKPEKEDLASLDEREMARRIAAMIGMLELVKDRARAPNSDVVPLLNLLKEYRAVRPHELALNIFKELNRLLEASGAKAVTWVDLDLDTIDWTRNYTTCAKPEIQQSGRKSLEQILALFPDDIKAAIRKLSPTEYLDIWRKLDLARPGAGAFSYIQGNKTLSWLCQLQRPDGSFGECMHDGLPYGSRDMRFCYMAAAVRWMLRRPNETAPDFDVHQLMNFICGGQTYDGGIAETSGHEAHAGYAFCGVAAMELLVRPPNNEPVSPQVIKRLFHNRMFDLDLMERWLYLRGGYISESEWSEDEGLVPRDGPETQTGFNGRCNKDFDSCYTWWVCGALKILGRLERFNKSYILDFLLRQMQHPLAAGFSKNMQGRPDIYHSFLGLASCAILAEDGLMDVTLKSLDPALVVSKEAVDLIVEQRESAHEWDSHGNGMAIMGEGPEY